MNKNKKVTFGKIFFVYAFAYAVITICFQIVLDNELTLSYQCSTLATFITFSVIPFFGIKLMPEKFKWTFLKVYAVILPILTSTSFAIAFEFNPDPLFVVCGILAPVGVLLALPVYTYWKKSSM